MRARKNFPTHLIIHIAAFDPNFFCVVPRKSQLNRLIIYLPFSYNLQFLQDRLELGTTQDPLNRLKPDHPLRQFYFSRLLHYPVRAPACNVNLRIDWLSRIDGATNSAFTLISRLHVLHRRDHPIARHRYGVAGR